MTRVSELVNVFLDLLSLRKLRRGKRKMDD
jgi:hypothetical protein